MICLILSKMLASGCISNTKNTVWGTVVFGWVEKCTSDSLNKLGDLCDPPPIPLSIISKTLPGSFTDTVFNKAET